MAEPRVVAVIQARMSSTRFPGKVLMPLAGKPVLWHIVHRLRKSTKVTDIAIATSTGKADDAIAEFAAREDLPLVRGSEENVLSRFLLAAKSLHPDLVLRVTGDAPLVDPQIIDLMVETLLLEDAEFCVGHPDTPTIHEGFGLFTRAALDRLAQEANDDPVAREHVDAYFKLHPERFRTAYARIPAAHHIAGTRVSVDTPADLDFLSELYCRLGALPGELDLAEAVTLLKRHSDLLLINAHVRQKDVLDLSHRVLIRCDGDSRIGLGHVMRCLSIAEELRDNKGCGVEFAMAAGTEATTLLQQAGFLVHSRVAEIPEEVWLGNLIAERGSDAVLLDLRNDLPASAVAAWRAQHLTATLDDASDRRLHADLAFYPPVPQVQDLDWNGYTGRRFWGWEWVVLGPAFRRLQKPRPGTGLRLLVTMGGSDPGGFTFKALDALEQISSKMEICIVLGAAFANRPELEERLKSTTCSCQIKERVTDMPSLMAEADLAVAAFGVTAYELAAMGVPALLLSLTEDHARSADALAASGGAISLGVGNALATDRLAEEIDQLANNEPLRRAMRTAARRQIDGLGANRIAEIMMAEMDRRKTGKRS